MAPTRPCTSKLLGTRSDYFVDHGMLIDDNVRALRTWIVVAAIIDAAVFLARHRSASGEPDGDGMYSEVEVPSHTRGDHEREDALRPE